MFLFWHSLDVESCAVLLLKELLTTKPLSYQKKFESKMDTKRPPKEIKKLFNKVKFLQTWALLNSRFNYETLKFERYWPLRLRCDLITFFKATLPLKLIVSLFFERDDEIQLLIGKLKEIVLNSHVSYTM